MVCSKCGAQLPNDAVFCNNCGANVSQSTQQPQMQNQQPQMQNQQPQMQYQQYQQMQPKPEVIQPKAKTGITVGLVAAAMFFLGMISDYSSSVFALIPIGALACFVLFKEQDNWLRKCAVRAVGTVLAFFVLGFLIDAFFDFFNVIQTFVSWDVNSSLGFFNKLHDIRNIFITILNAVQHIVLFVMGVHALAMKTTKMPVVDGLIDRHMK